MTTEELLSQVRDELARLRTTVESSSARTEERCSHRGSTLARHEKALDEYFTRLRTVEKNDAQQIEGLKRLEKTTEANARAIADLVGTVNTLKGTVDRLVTSGDDRESRVRELEKWRWYLVGGGAVLVAAVQLVIKYVLP